MCAVVIGFVLVTGGLGMASEIWFDTNWEDALTLGMLFSAPFTDDHDDDSDGSSPPLLGSQASGHASSSSSTSEQHGGGGFVALGAALLSLVCKEGLYRATSHMGRALNSVALISNAAHYRSDAFASLVAVAGQL